MEWVFIGLLVIFIIGCIKFMIFYKNRSYLDLWQKDYYKIYHDPRKQMIAHGLLASSGHNIQPWKFILTQDRDAFDMYIDRDYLTKHVDPDQRQLIISQGTCLKNMEIAAQALGYDLEVSFEFNDEWYNYQRLAHIVIKKTESKIYKNYAHIFKPDTHRGIYKDMKLSEDMKKNLESINTYEGLTLSLYDDQDDINRIGYLALEGASIEARNQDVMHETYQLFKNNEALKRNHPYGFSLEGQGLSTFMIWFIQILIKFFPSFNHPDQTKKAFLNGAKSAIDHTYTYVMIKSNDLKPRKLIDVGMLYQDLILKLHELELVIQPLSQAIEVYDDMKPVYEKIHKDYGNDKHIVMLARIGYPIKAFKRSMRFKPEQVIEEVIS